MQVCQRIELALRRRIEKGDFCQRSLTLGFTQVVDITICIPNAAALMLNSVKDTRVAPNEL